MNAIKLLENTNRVRLVQFSNGQFLDLVRHDDGRIDLIDYGCADTGSNLESMTMVDLINRVGEWLTCVECTTEQQLSAISNMPVGN